MRGRAKDILQGLGKRSDSELLMEKEYITTSSTYDPQAAANYADTWWNGRNPAYHDYGDYDCANFVSQCLIAGGLSLSAGPGVDSWGCIPYCDNLHLNLVNSQGATHERKNRGESEPIWFVKGDPALFGNYSDYWTHAVFAVTGDASNYCQCNAHSYNQYHQTISWFFAVDPNFDVCNYYHIEQTGYASVSQGVTVTPTPVVLDQNFTVSFTLKEIQGGSITFEQVAVAILRSDNSHLFDLAMYDNVTISANGTWSQSPTGQIYSSSPPGTYKAIIKGKVAGGG